MGAVPLAYYQFSGLTTVKTLAQAVALASGIVPDAANSFLVIVETQSIRWTSDGLTNPTATVGMIIVAGVPVLFEGRAVFNKVRFIEVAATAVMNIQFFKN